ncbi:hypothetical protein H5410_016017 [Solanum commersonii]|uniref:Uncharacterized protein n=1 Tax=Solanum commersonii TaxID=4109 RepID=A0A9J5ZVB3_SOLCO|nr:hypothetical protein H5410_016017 [Solanum commersonii]
MDVDPDLDANADFELIFLKVILVFLNFGYVLDLAEYLRLNTWSEDFFVCGRLADHQ